MKGLKTTMRTCTRAKVDLLKVLRLGCVAVDLQTSVTGSLQFSIAALAGAQEVHTPD